ncbi:acyl-CoA N-acyltransferase [Xylaria sp. FL1777]|nr:acyl-CoA N-acyltransferase [Xylaria sp. FL1777]
MALLLSDIDPDVDFPALTRCVLEAYEDPPQSFVYMFFQPMHGTGAVSREAAIEEAAARLKLWHTSDPSSRWQKVVDTETGKVVGGAAWNIYTTNPFEELHELHDMEVTWYPGDTSRTYVEKALENYGMPRYRAAQRPHLYLFNIFTHPEYRRRGVGQQIMDWGMKQADALELELFLDATPHGKPLYEKNGFICIEENVTNVKTDNPDGKWKEMEDQIGSFTFWLMWRPVGGKYEEGKTVKPWESKDT